MVTMSTIFCKKAELRNFLDGVLCVFTIFTNTSPNSSTCVLCEIGKEF